MNFLRSKTNIGTGWIVILLLIIIWAAFTYFFFDSPSGKWEIFWGGASAGMIAILFDTALSMYKYGEIDKLKGFGIIEILPERRGAPYYSKLLSGAYYNVQVLGTTCNRFINDFANLNSEDKVLVDALEKNKNLHVKLLVASESYLDENSKLKMQGIKGEITALEKKYKGRFQVQYYDFAPRHSIVRVDEEIIIGPVFQEVESQHSPAIHMNVYSFLAKKYLAYFDWVWKQSHK
jgi:hypothetical protein